LIDAARRQTTHEQRLAGGDKTIAPLKCPFAPPKISNATPAVRTDIFNASECPAANSRPHRSNRIEAVDGARLALVAIEAF
jgi:hypothetical protein